MSRYSTEMGQQNRLRLIEKFVEAYEEDQKTVMILKVGEEIRSKGYATMEELLELVKWKFPISIAHVNIPNNTEDDVKKLTEIVLKEKLSDSQKVRILMGLTGIKERMASAILTLINPENYGTFDINARKALENLGFIKANELSEYKVEDYIEYLRIIREIAREISTCTIKRTPRDVDRALYYYGRHLNKKCPVCNL